MRVRTQEAALARSLACTRNELREMIDAVVVVVVRASAAIGRNIVGRPTTIRSLDIARPSARAGKCLSSAKNQSIFWSTKRANDFF